MRAARRSFPVDMGPDLFAWADSAKPAARTTHLPAAVVTDQDAAVARVVPPTAKLVRAATPGDTSGRSGNVVLGYRAKPTRLRKPWSIAEARLIEIERLILHRHGGPCDLSSPGLEYIEVAVPHILALAVTPRTPLYRTQPVLWAQRWAPRLLDEMLDQVRDVRVLDEIERMEAEARSRKRPLRADAIARLLQVTRA